MRVDLSAAKSLRVAGRNVAEVIIAGRRVWPRPAPLVSRIAGVGYAGSIYQVAHAGTGRWQYDAGGGWSDFAPAQGGGTLTTGLAQDGAAISWLRDDGARSNVSPRLWTPYGETGLAGLFDPRRMGAGAVSAWEPAAGAVRYVQADPAKRPVFEAAGLGSAAPCVFLDWNRALTIEGLSPAPAARTLIGMFSFLGTDPFDSFMQISNSQPGAWTLRKSYLTGGKRWLSVMRSQNTEPHDSAVVLTDNTPCLVSAKDRRPSGEYGFRLNGAAAGGGTAPLAAFTNNGGIYTLAGYIRLGPHAYFDTYLTLEDEISFEGWCAWTQGLVSRLPVGHPCEHGPPLVS